MLTLGVVKTTKFKCAHFYKKGKSKYHNLLIKQNALFKSRMPRRTFRPPNEKYYAILIFLLAFPFKIMAF